MTLKPRRRHSSNCSIATRTMKTSLTCSGGSTIRKVHRARDGPVRAHPETKSRHLTKPSTTSVSVTRHRAITRPRRGTSSRPSNWWKRIIRNTSGPIPTWRICCSRLVTRSGRSMRREGGKPQSDVRAQFLHRSEGAESARKDGTCVELAGARGGPQSDVIGDLVSAGDRLPETAAERQSGRSRSEVPRFEGPRTGPSPVNAPDL